MQRERERFHVAPSSRMNNHNKWQLNNIITHTLNARTLIFSVGSTIFIIIQSFKILDNDVWFWNQNLSTLIISVYPVRFCFKIRKGLEKFCVLFATMGLERQQMQRYLAHWIKTFFFFSIFYCGRKRNKKLWYWQGTPTFVS